VSEQHPQHGGRAVLAFGTLGIVFGDIGTSPIYAFRESFHHAELEITRTTTYGAASIAFWALVIVISVKYLWQVMRADNHGEGGILALTSLVIPPEGQTVSRIAAGVVTLGVFGTALLYGDGLITPAISVLSAVEGFEVATPAFSDWVIPIAVVILVALFAVQQRGTAGIAKVFSPVMVIWFSTIGVLGVNQIRKHPDVLRAVSPTYAVEFFTSHPWKAFVAMGSIFLVVTGGEALYADMGHFGRRPIQIAWYGLVLPGLLCNYFGQAALLSTHPFSIDEETGERLIGEFKPFFDMAPEWAIWPVAILATMATVIASQALISGAFSLTVQAVQLDYLPRLAILHTSEKHIGQVYVPLVNWLLMIGCVGLVITFQNSSNLAAAYGIAVTMTMFITTLIFYRFVRDKWAWSAPKALAILIPLMLVDLAFLGANILKIPEGGWFPLLVGFGLVIQMTTWRKGRQLVAARIRRGERPMREVVQEALDAHVARVPGVAVYMFKDEGAAPPALMSNLKHNRVLHETVLLVSVHTEDVPRIDESERAVVTDLGEGILQVRFNYGFMEDPDIPVAMAAHPEIDADVEQATYFLGRESVTAGKAPGMHPWREELFVLLNRGAANASRFFRLPSDQVFEVGTHVEI
jgi:KUP system potassium uptake protein